MNESQQHFANCWLLHVDDSEDDSILFQRALTKLGFQGHYEWVDSGDAALSRLSTSKIPDVIVTDGHMAAGPDVVRRMREALGRDDVPIVVYSGDCDTRAMDEALRHGATGYLLKQTNFEASLVAVRRILAECDQHGTSEMSDL